MPKIEDWITADDRLPELGQEVLVYAGSGWFAVRYAAEVKGITVSGKETTRKCWYPGGVTVQGSYWMPLPEKPHAEG